MGEEAVKIADLHHDEYWRATVTLPTPPDGVTFTVDRKWGSWQRVEGDRRYDIPARIAAALQARVKVEERRAARASG